jgi:hypothetical protein
MRAELCKDENRRHDSIWSAEAGAAVLCQAARLGSVGKVILALLLLVHATSS